MTLLGYDIGSSSIKASIIDVLTGKCIAKAQFPDKEMEISAPKEGCAEQNPKTWWENIIEVTKIVLSKPLVDSNKIKAIGISYQMHGLVIIDKDRNPLRPSIIWCDSRAVSYGEKAFYELGEEKCLNVLLNTPGNFTASKLKWVKENEPEIYKKIFKFMLPGDFIAMKLTGNCNTTVTGLSEGILWNFAEQNTAKILLDYYGISKELIPDLVPIMGIQGYLQKYASEKLGLPEGLPITYRSGDQPNNALSLNVLKPGEVAATAGTSGVVYGITDKIIFDRKSRINTFIHVNHKPEQPRYGVMLCINGTGISYSWIKKFVGNNLTYNELNKKAESSEIGSKGLIFIPFGNGAERMFENKILNAGLYGINYNMHGINEIIRSIIEGIAFSFAYGMKMLNKTGIKTQIIKAGNANLFLSHVFRQTLANATGSVIEIYDTEGASGAAIGAGIGAGLFKTEKEAFKNLKMIKIIKPESENLGKTKNALNNWIKIIENELNKS